MLNRNSLAHPCICCNPGVSRTRVTDRDPAPSVELASDSGLNDQNRYPPDGGRVTRTADAPVPTDPNEVGAVALRGVTKRYGEEAAVVHHGVIHDNICPSARLL